MANRYDIEAFCDNVGAFLQANINSKITSINTEKNDSFTLTQIDSGAIFFQTLGDEVANYNPFILYGIADMPAENAYSEIGVIVRLQVCVILADAQNATETIRKLLRYQRALIELFTSNYSDVGVIGKVKVSGLMPVDIKLLNRSSYDKVIGIELEAAIA